jgi:hypothetical protein
MGAISETVITKLMYSICCLETPDFSRPPGADKNNDLTHIQGHIQASVPKLRQRSLMKICYDSLELSFHVRVIISKIFLLQGKIKICFRSAEMVSVTLFA